MRFRLRTLLIVLAVGPVVLAFGWRKYSDWKAEQERRRAEEEAIMRAIISYSAGFSRD
jgi:hypothetical protein